jgi:exodeoxyribonuclease-3
MKIATWNVNGIRARQAQVAEWLEHDGPDVVCLQELKAEPAQVPECCRHPGYTTLWHGHKGYSGVSLHVRNGAFDVEPAFAHPDFDMETRVVYADLRDLVVASVYVPNGGKDYAAKLSFLARLAEWTARLRAEGREFVLCGDLNVAHTDMDVHARERKPGIVGQRPDERGLFDALLRAGVVDVQRRLHPQDDTLFTWWAPWRNMRQRNIGWRIDYVLASPGVAQRATSCVVLADVGTSDHAPVVMTLG